jgi:hypothetical protein
MRKLFTLMAMCLIAGVASFPPVANATLTLSLSEGSTTVIFMDGGTGDLNTTTGMIT